MSRIRKLKENLYYAIWTTFFLTWFLLYRNQEETNLFLRMHRDATTLCGVTSLSLRLLKNMMDKKIP
jgi:hypothetical protein